MCGFVRGGESEDDFEVHWAALALALRFGFGLE